MAPEYSRAAKSLSPLIPLYAVDCDAQENKQLCSEQVRTLANYVILLLTDFRAFKVSQPSKWVADGIIYILKA